MKIIFGIITSILLIVLLFGSTATISSCKKTITVYDTTIVRDTVCDCESGLVAKYTFTGGTLNDSSGYGNNIVFNNATVTADRNGVANNAYLFNGTSSYMTVMNDISLNPTNITLFAIVKPNGFYLGECHANQILGKGSPDGVQGFYTLRFTDSTHTCPGQADITKEVFYGEFGNNVPAGTDAGAQDHSIVKTGQWYKLAFTYDGKESKLYVNGVLVDKRQRKVAFTPNTQNLFIGKNENSQVPYYFNGIIDEIRIYNHAICESGIKELSK